MKKMEKMEKVENKAFLQALILLSQLSWSMAIAILAGAFAGHWLDKKFDTNPLFFILLICLGVVVGITAMYRQIIAATKRKDRK